jgi:phytoene synthase
MEEAYEHCEALVRERDRDRFLANLFAPADKRSHLFALHAFDLEIAHIPDAVREPMAGEIRLQWWREALMGERVEEARANPVAAALIGTTKQYDLPLQELTGMIDARQFDLRGGPMESREKLLQYVDRVWGAPVALGTKVLMPKWSMTDAVQNAGRVVGLTSVLRNLRHDVSRGRLLLPLDLLGSQGIHTASVIGGESTTELKSAIAEVIGWARGAFDELRRMEIPQTALPIFLPIVLAPIYLAKLSKVEDVFRARIQVSAFRSQFAVWLAARRGRL